ncbi:MAG: hypothetical protein JXA69_03070 [Phycisphaerae bacterium]|nr:hypothetical protein [Phycisphaerae bacterium]
MAKQSVSFVERHVEKIVLGVAGAVFVVFAVLFWFGAPNSTTSLATEPVAPAHVGTELVTLARSTYDAIGRAVPDAASVALPDATKRRPSEIDVALTQRWALAPTPPHRRPPTVDALPPDMVQLATILPPGKPAIVQGRHRATLPVPNPLPGDATVGDRPSRDPLAPTSKDLTWVTVAVPVSHAAQREAFRAAAYHPAQARLVLTRVGLQRQQLQTDGAWTEPEAVPTFVTYDVPDIRRVRLVQGQQGWAVEPASEKQVRSLLDGITRPAVQTAIWRPPLAPYLDASEWTPPDVEGVDWRSWTTDSAEPGSAYERSGAAEAAPEAPAAPAEAAELSDRDKRRQAREALRDGEKALDDGDLVRAKTMLETVTASLLSASEISRLERAKAKLDEQQAKLDEPRGEMTEADKGVEDAGPVGQTDVEPVWASDCTVRPGVTYRYRVRLEAYHPYVGQPDEFEKPTDAEPVVLTSDWSVWSEPVMVRPDVYFFFTRATESDGSVSVEIFKWAEGMWHVKRGKYEVGHRIRYDDKVLGVIDTQMTVMEIEFGVRRSVRVKARRGDAFTIEEQNVNVLVLADTDGRVHERTDAEDSRSDERAALREEMKQAEASQKVRATPAKPAQETGA